MFINAQKKCSEKRLKEKSKATNQKRDAIVHVKETVDERWAFSEEPTAMPYERKSAFNRQSEHCHQIWEEKEWQR